MPLFVTELSLLLSLMSTLVKVEISYFYMDYIDCSLFIMDI